MVEAGADQVPEEKLLEALELAQREIVKLCEAQEELQARAGKPKWLDPASRERLDEPTATRSHAAIAEQGPPRRGVDRRGDRRARGRHADDGLDRGRRHPRAPGADVARLILEKKRSAAVEAPGARAVRERPARR